MSIGKSESRRASRPKQGKATPKPKVAKSKLQQMGFDPIDPARVQKVLRLGIERVAGWLYFLHRSENQILRAPYDPAQQRRVPKDDAELVAKFEGTLNRTTHLQIVDADGDVAQFDRRIGCMYMMDAHGTVMERADHASTRAERAPLDPEHVKTVLEDLNESAPDTFDEGRFGSWTFDAIEKTAKHWLVAFENAHGSDYVAFSTRHALVDDDGTSSQDWINSLIEAIGEWEKDQPDLEIDELD
jgi:hypothetical protein